jgi:hypothetical protein
MQRAKFGFSHDGSFGGLFAGRFAAKIDREYGGYPTTAEGSTSSSWQSDAWSANRVTGGYGLAAILSSKRG